MIKVTKDNFNNTVENAKGVVVIDLYADWCGPCKMMAPIFEELEGKMPEATFCKVNVDEEPELAAMFKVESIPMIAIVKDATFMDFSVGYKSSADLYNFISQYI